MIFYPVVGPSDGNIRWGNFLSYYYCYYSIVLSLLSLFLVVIVVFVVILGYHCHCFRIFDKIRIELTVCRMLSQCVECAAHRANVLMSCRQ